MDSRFTVNARVICDFGLIVMLFFEKFELKNVFLLKMEPVAAGENGGSTEIFVYRKVFC